MSSGAWCDLTQFAMRVQMLMHDAVHIPHVLMRATLWICASERRKCRNNLGDTAQLCASCYMDVGPSFIGWLCAQRML